MSTSRRWHTRTPRNKFVGSGRNNWADTINRKQERQDHKEKFLSLKSVEKKEHKSEFFKVTYNKCGKYGTREEDFWGNENKGNKNKNNRKP